MRNRTQAARGRVWALLVVASIAMFQLQFVMTPTASADNACSGAFSGTPDGSLRLVAVPNGGSEGSPASIAAGTPISLKATWDPADWSSLDRYANCLEATVNGTTSVSTISALRPPELSNTNPTVNDSYTVPSTWTAGDSFCIRARLSGTPTAQNTSTQKSDILCWKIGDAPPKPDVEIKKTSSKGTVAAGDSFFFTLTAKNVSTVTATNVVIKDSVPSRFTVVSVSGAGCSFSGQNVSCDPVSLNPGDTKVVTVNVTTTAGACATIDNTATVTATDDTNAGNNSDTTRVNVTCDTPKPDVEIKKTSTKSTVAGGESFSFTLTAKNISTVTATNVVIKDSVPSRFTVVSVSGAGCSFSGQNVSCDPVTLAAGESKVVTVNVKATVGACATIDNTATVTATDDTNPNNNSDKATVSVTCDKPDVLIDKASSKGTVAGGESFSFTLTARNVSNVTATNVVISDTVPSRFTVLSVSGAGCSASGQTVTCSPVTLAPNESKVVTINVTATVGACAEIDNTATVTATDDTNASNNSDSARVSVTCDQPDVKIEKTSGAPTTGVKPGESFTYTLKVSNIGGATATGVKAMDTVPAGLTITDYPSTCTVSGRDITCTLGDIAAGGNASVTFTVKASEDACPMVTNRATVTASNAEANTTNNTSNDVTTPVNCEPPPPEEGIAVRIVKTNDADRDGDYSDNEEARRPDADVPFLLVITNTGEDPWTITDLTDKFQGETLNLLRDKCSDLKGITLQPGESVACNFTLNGYAPPADDPKDNVAEVCVESMTGTKTDCDDDDSRVRSRDVLGRTITPTKTPPGGTAYTGSEGSLGFGAIALALLLLGSGLMWAGYRRRQQYDG